MKFDFSKMLTYEEAYKIYSKYLKKEQSVLDVSKDLDVSLENVYGLVELLNHFDLPVEIINVDGEEVIRKYRKQNGWTQKELAKRCCYSENFIGDIENETFKTFSLNTLYHISKVLGVHIKLLFEDLDEEQKK